ncbi:MAG: CHAP domain-containing protein [Coriobacteriales bacterium]|jgi:hypothetical protein|nr:CHAP domain-containing protein [Coriobacteriales bacterium]
MNKTIKTRDILKDIKVLDKKAGLSATRGVHAKAKEVAERDEGPGQQHRHGVDYAQDKVEQAVKAEGRGAVKGAGKAVSAIREVRNLTKDIRQEAQKTRRVTEAVRKQIAAARRQEALTHKQTTRTAGQAAPKVSSRTMAANGPAAQATSRQAATGVANTTRTANTASAAVRAAGQTTAKTTRVSAKPAVKTTTKTVKTAGATAAKAVKTSRQTARAARASAKATQVTAKNAAQAARAASRAAVAATRAAVKGIAAFVRMAIAAINSLVAAIAAGGWVAVAVIVIICLVGLIAASAFGIFFTGGDMGDGNPTLREVITEINREHQEEIDRIRADNPHDEVMVSGVRAPWREVLAVYAVEVTTNIDDPLDVITLDERRQRMLKDIYGDMNVIDYRTEDREYTEIIAVEQDDGSITEETQTYSRRTLYIVQSAKTAEQMAEELGFTASQREMLLEMLDSRYADAWQSVLYGTRPGSGDIVEVAASQIGNPGGQSYWSWYGFSSRVEWCACFVSWCANECGYLEAGIIPRHSYCQTGISWFRDAEYWQDAGGGFEPSPGDIIYFDWGDGGDSDHVGIVERVEGGRVYTIEGNSGDAVRRNSYSLSSPSIIGFGVPDY